MAVMSADLSIAEAERIVWERRASGQPLACDRYWPGPWSVADGEARCSRCEVPVSVHRAMQVLRKIHHG